MAVLGQTVGALCRDLRPQIGSQVPPFKVIQSYGQTVTRDEQTDRQTDGRTVGQTDWTPTSKLECWRAVIKQRKQFTYWNLTFIKRCINLRLYHKPSTHCPLVKIDLKRRIHEQTFVRNGRL